jgi:preprotein translocase subunit SecB
MADNTTGKNGSGAGPQAGGPVAAGPQAGPGPGQLQVRVLGQFIKDLSFENPNLEKVMAGPGEDPKLQVNINVGGKRMGQPHVFESTIEFNAQATSNIGVIYELELLYGGLFRIENIPEQALEPFLLINCPTLMFPFVRRLVADVTREAGYPPLLLDPVDFAGLFMERKRQEAAQGGAGGAKV